MKILIADDESLVRRSVLLFLEDLGVARDDVVEAANGKELLAAVKEHHFDLALVDIRMPAMDGLTAIREAKALAPWTDYYILTGFDDFDYAREGIRLGVRDYILKPLKRDELERILEETISALEQRTEERKRTLNLYIMALFSSADGELRLPFPCRPLLVTDDVPDFPFSVSELLEKDEGRLTVLSSRQPEGTFLFLFELPEHPGYANVWTEQLVSRYGNRHTVIEGKTVQSGAQWQDEYRRLVSLSNARFLFGVHRLYRSSVRVPELSAPQRELCLACGRALAAFSSGDYARFSLSCQTPASCLDQTEGNHSPAAENLRAFLVSAWSLDGGSAGAMKNGLRRKAATMIQNTSRDFRFQEILQYLEEHFREDLSLSGTAEIFGLSPNYFSSLFKKNTGRGFIRYLSELRIREGKRLLLDSSKTVCEISAASGYCSASFFIRSFKKAEGITPLEFRKRCGSQPSALPSGQL